MIVETIRKTASDVSDRVVERPAVAPCKLAASARVPGNIRAAGFIGRFAGAKE